MLRDISLSYDPEEDRLRLRIRSGSDDDMAVHRVALTRRVALAWRADLRVMQEAMAQLPAALPQPVRQEWVQGHQSALSEQLPRRKLPPAPEDLDPSAYALALQVSCGRRRSDKRWVVTIRSRGVPTATLTLADNVTAALATMLEQRLAEARWLATPAAASNETKPAPASSSQPLH